MTATPNMLRTAVPAWPTIPSVSYRLTEDEARAALPQTWLQPIWGLNVVIQFGNGIFHIGRPDVMDRGMGVLFLGIAGMFAAQLWAIRRPWPARGQRDFTLSFDELGIHSAQPVPALASWKSITSVHDAGSVFLFTQSKRRTIIVPKRAFPDNGQALWAILVDRLIAKGSLRRRADSRTIVNTAMA